MRKDRRLCLLRPCEKSVIKSVKVMSVTFHNGVRVIVGILTFPQHKKSFKGKRYSWICDEILAIEYFFTEHQETLLKHGSCLLRCCQTCSAFMGCNCNNSILPNANNSASSSSSLVSLLNLQTASKHITLSAFRVRVFCQTNYFLLKSFFETALPWQVGTVGVLLAARKQEDEWAGL